MSEVNNAPVHVRHRLLVAELTSGHARKPVEMVNWIQGASNEAGEVAGRVKLNDFAQALANAESAQPAEQAVEWVSVELAPLLGVLAYLNAEIGQYHKEHHAPSRIRRAKELLEMALPPQPQPKGET